MKKIFMLAMVLGLVGCKADIDTNEESNQLETQPETALPVDEKEEITTLEGQIFYSAEEIADNPEPDGFGETIGGYHLDGLRVYLIGTKRSYKMYPDFEGVFFGDLIEPGTYQMLIKSYETFIDEGGEFTYQYFTNIRIKKGQHNVLPLINVRKVYVDKSLQEEVEVE